MSNSIDQGTSQAVVHDKTTEAEERVNEGGGEYRYRPGVEAEEMQGDTELDDSVPTTSLPYAVNPASAKKAFGTIKRPSLTAKKANDLFNYEGKYPEDALYEETTSNARVWRTYEDESKSYDANMVEESRDNVDVMLVFAGLFSAVVTTFVAQTYQNLQADYTAISASLLYELVLVQRAIANGATVNSITPSSLNPSIAFVPAATDVWVNGLWFTSLFLSLTTALVAVLVKQWLHHYVALPSGTPRDHSLTRQFRYAGFQKWHVQVIIGLLPVFMHLALAIFLVGLAVFLHPLREALSWIICTGTLLVYVAYVTATILPMFFPQCPYRTPICDLIYLSFRRIIPEITWVKDYFLDAWRRGNYNDMVHRLPTVKARSSKSLTMVESELVQQMSTNLAAEALDWLFSASSNPSVQSIVVQSVGGLPMASNEMFGLQPSIQAARGVHKSLLRSCLQADENQPNYDKPVPGLELKVERLLRFYAYHFRYIIPPDVDSFELIAAIQSLDVPGLQARGRPAVLLNSAAYFKDIIHPSHSVKLPPISWSRLVVLAERDGIFSPLDPHSDNHANMFPLHLCTIVLRSFRASQKGLKQDFTSPLALEFKDALPYFPDKIYGDVLNMLSKFIRDPPLDQSPLPKSLRVFVVAIEFLLHRLSLPGSDIFHTFIHTSLTAAVNWASSQKFSSQDAAAVITMLEGILVACVTQERDPRNVESQWNKLCYNTIHAYWYSLAISPSACSLRGLQLMVDFMTVNWEQHPQSNFYQSDIACWALADLLANRIPAAYAVFHERQCLDFFESHAFHEASVRVISEYVAGISVMLHGRGGVMDATMLQQHVDRLHESRHLFTVFLILAAHSAEDTDQTVIHGDITALMLLRPHDAAWDECYKKLYDLIDSDDTDFFTQQRVPVSPSVNRALEVREVQIERDNIKFAIKLCDGFFAGVRGQVPSDLPLAQRTCIRCFLGWCTGRQPEDKSDREQHV